MTGQQCWWIKPIGLFAVFQRRLERDFGIMEIANQLNGLPDSKRYSKCQLYNLVDKVLHNPQQPPIPSPLSHKNPMVVSYDNSILFVGGEEFSDQKAPQVLQYKVGENFTMDTWEKLDQKLPFEVSKGKSLILPIKSDLLECTENIV